VFFQVRQTSFPDANDVYRHDLKNQTNQLACSGALGFSVSADGNVIAYLNMSLPDRGVCVRDMHSNNMTLIAPFYWPTDYAFTPQVSSDGRYVIFASGSANLVSNDTNNAADIFVYDRVAQTTILVSRNSSGGVGNGSSSQPMLAPDGRTVLFTSSADNLATNDFNNARDIFVVRLGGEDSDLDGMDDDWEATYFNTLARDGSGDFDGDGASDRHEFDAVTDPGNSGSLFRAITVENAEGSDRTILWRAQAGQRYRVEFKNEVNDPYWEELGTIAPSSATGFLVDNAAEPHRIYRVVLAP
jgi:hypothetical protein